MSKVVESVAEILAIHSRFVDRIAELIKEASDSKHPTVVSTYDLLNLLQNLADELKPQTNNDDN